MVATRIRNASDPKQRKVVVELAAIRQNILNDIANIEARDSAAMSARMSLTLHMLDFNAANGLNLRPENIGTLTNEMLTAKDGWAATSLAPTLGLVWKTLSASRKSILKEAAKLVHWLVKGKLVTDVNGKRTNKNDELFINMEYATETMKAKAKGSPVFPFSFNELLRYATEALSEQGEEQASGIELQANKMVKALDEKTAEDIPAGAWNTLSVLAGRISKLMSERAKLQEGTETEETKAAKAKGTKVA